jgi:hypothetical protein
MIRVLIVDDQASSRSGMLDLAGPLELLMKPIVDAVRDSPAGP